MNQQTGFLDLDSSTQIHADLNGKMCLSWEKRATFAGSAEVVNEITSYLYGKANSLKGLHF